VDSITLKAKKTMEKIHDSRNIKLNIFLSCVVIAVLVILSAPPAVAEYNFNGVPFTDQLDDVEHGTVDGSVYVDGGHGIGPSPYTQSFNVPEGEVRWARLYVGVWGGNEVKTGRVDVTFNGKELETLDLEGEADTNSNVYCSGHGVYWIYYKVADNTTSGPIDAVVTTSGAIDGRVYGIVLVAVIEEKDGTDVPEVQYWINEGNVNLHGPGWSGEHGTNDEAVAEFDGTVDIDKFVAARLAVVYLTGTPGLNDYLYFNDEKLCDGDNCDDIANSKKSFDIKTFDVIDYIEKEANKATFELGDEDYVHPVLAVLSLHTEEEGDSDLTVSNVAVPILYTGSTNTISATIENIGDDPAYGFQAALYVDSEVVSTASISSLVVDRNKTVDFTWKPDREGEHILWVYVDHFDKKAELCEINNNNTPLTVNVIDFTPPEIEIDQPEDGEIVDTDVITISGTIEDTSKNITVLVNGAPVILSGKKWSAPVSLYYGYNKIIVNAVDGANNSATEFVLVRSLVHPNVEPDSIPSEESKGIIDTAMTVVKAPVDKIGRLFFVVVVLIIIVSIAAVYWWRKRLK
jgi:subtilase family serine protease